MKANAVAHVEDVILWIRNFPAFGNARQQVEVVVFANQGIEDQFINALGLGVFADPRIKIGWAALNHYYQRVPSRFLGAGNQAREQQQQKAF